MTGVLVQQMVPHGVEMIVGALQDPTFGPLVACGTGGVLVDVLADTAFRLHPLSATDAREMIDELRGARLLRGYRGSPPADEADHSPPVPTLSGCGWTVVLAPTSLGAPPAAGTTNKPVPAGRMPRNETHCPSGDHSG